MINEKQLDRTVMYPVHCAESTRTNDSPTSQFRLLDESQHRHVRLCITRCQWLSSQDRQQTDWQTAQQDSQVGS